MRKCWEKMEERMKKGKELFGWERKKEEFFVKRGMIAVEVERKRWEREIRYEEMERKEREKQRGERWEKIRESRYNKWYKEVKEDGITGIPEGMGRK